jgi:hypothetical protein
MADRQFLEQLSRRLADDGKLNRGRLGRYSAQRAGCSVGRNAHGVHGRRAAPIRVDYGRLAGDAEPDELLALSADLAAISAVVREEAMCDVPA